MVEQLKVEHTKQGPKLVGSVNRAIAARCEELGYKAAGCGDMTWAVILYADQETGMGISALSAIGGPEVAQTIQMCMIMAVGLQHLIDIGDPEGLRVQAVLAEFDEALAKYGASQPVTMEDILDEKH